MSTSRSRADKGKGKAPQEQDDGSPRVSSHTSVHPGRGRGARSRRAALAEEISVRFAEQLQAQEDAEYARLVHRQEEEQGEDPNPSDGSDEEGEDEQEEQDEVQQTNTRPLTSKIFTKHFKKMPIPLEPGQKELPGKKKFIAYCNYCTKHYKWTQGGGYGTLTRHMETIHPTEYGIDASQAQIVRQSGVGGSSSVTGTHSLFKFEPNYAQDCLAQYVSMEKHPFSHADRETWEWHMQKYQPASKKVGRTQMLSRIRRLCFDNQKILMKYLIRLDHKVSICADIWTDNYHRNNFMGITCHWIDDKWMLQKRLLAFREFNESHSAHNIALMIITVLNEYSLVNKVFSVGFDNASANSASIPELIEACNPSFQGKYFHSRCICHILNLCVQDALDIFQESVLPIRRAVTMLHGNITLAKKWQKYCRHKSIPYRMFHRDVSHRWNSTYDMINSTMDFKGHLCDFFRKEFSSVQLTLLPSHWDQCMELYNLLKVFNVATKQLSGVYYCTSVRVLDHCTYIALSFKNCYNTTNLQGVVYFMVKKWLKYFAYIPDVFLVAKCLDPKWKYDGVCQMLELYYNTFASMDFLNVRIDGDDLAFDLPNVAQIKEDLIRTLRSLFAEYRMTHGSVLNMNEPPPPTYSSSCYPLDLNSLDPLVTQLHDMYQSRSSTTPLGQGNSELDLYLGSRHIFGVEDSGPHIDVLKWWSQRSEYPILSIMAKELFAVPASTVSVEQAFSIGGLVLDQRRSSMHPRNLEATMLLDDWSRAEMRLQENNWDDALESEDEKFTESERSEADEN